MRLLWVLGDRPSDLHEVMQQRCESCNLMDFNESDQDVPASSLAGWAFRSVNFKFGGTLNDSNVENVEKNGGKVRSQVKKDSRIIVDGSKVLPRQVLKDEIDSLKEMTKQKVQSNNVRASEFYKETIGHTLPSFTSDNQYGVQHCEDCKVNVDLKNWNEHVRGITHLHSLHSMHPVQSKASEIPLQLANQSKRKEQSPPGESVKLEGKSGHQLLTNLGWRGGGLGANEQGEREPIKVVIKQDRRALGQQPLGPIRIVGESKRRKKHALQRTGKTQRKDSERDERHRQRLLNYLKQ